jgi:hypothetical protein
LQPFDIVTSNLLFPTHEGPLAKGAYLRFCKTLDSVLTPNGAGVHMNVEDYLDEGLVSNTNIVILKKGDHLPLFGMQ